MAKLTRQELVARLGNLREYIVPIKEQLYSDTDFRDLTGMHAEAQDLFKKVCMTTTSPIILL